MTERFHFRLPTQVVRPIAAAVLTGSVLVVASPTRAVDPPPVVDSTSAVLDAVVGDPDGPDEELSLADAVWLANTDETLDTITFDLDPDDAGPIDTVNVPVITEDLEIVGPGRSRLTLTSSTGSVLTVDNDADISVSDIAVDGAAAGAGPFNGILLTTFGSGVFERVDLTNTVTGFDVNQPGPDPAGSFGAIDVTVSQATGPGVSTFNVADVVLDGVEVTDAPASTGIRVENATEVSVTEGSASDTLDGLLIDGVGDVTIAEFASGDNAQRGIVITSGYGTSTLTGVTVSGNGGIGIGVDASSASPPVGLDDLRDVSITDSTISSNDGGGVSIEAAGVIALTRLEIIGNGVAPSSGLGGVYLGSDSLDPSEVVISESIISDNSGDNGGGVTTSNHDGDVTISSSTITGNQASDGKALRIASTGGGGLVQVIRTVISGHTAGAAPVVYADGVPVHLIESNVTGNAAAALFVARSSDGSISVRDSTITGNSFDDAIFQNGEFSSVEAVETTVSGNTATDASAGVFRRALDGGQQVAVNAVLSGNGVAVAAGDSIAPDPSVTYSIVPTGSPAGTGTVEADDPGLGPLGDNGGPLPTMLPAENSPGVDAGDPAGATSATTTDQRGLTRVVNGRIDIGAVERQESPFVVGLPPARILETRSGPTFETIDDLFEGIGRRTNGSELTLDVAGRAGVPSDAEAVVVNVTAVAPSGVGFVTVHPCLVNPPLASSLNFRSDVDSGNEIVAELDADGNICLFNRTDTDLVVDVVGYVPVDSRYTPVGPARLLDTRFDAGDTIDGLFEQGGIRQSDTELPLDVAGRGGVSDDAVAVVVNVTAVKPVSIGYVTVHPCLPEEPTAASLNFEPGVNRGNEIVAQLDDQGRICLYTFGSAELVVDVVGQLTDENVYEPVPPARLVETRDVATGTIDDEQEAIGRLSARETLTVQAGGRAGIPAGAESIVVNVTAIRPDLRGFITVWDCTGSMPLAASLNYITDEIVGNELVVALDGGSFCVFTNRATDLTVDVVAHLS